MVSIIKGLSLISIGVLSLIWIFLKVISCIFIAGYISSKIGFSNLYWWFSTIIIFSIFTRLVCQGNYNDSYRELVDSTIKEDNHMLQFLKENQGVYDSKISFSDGSYFIVKKDMRFRVDDGFLFVEEANSIGSYIGKSFKLNEIVKLETMDYHIFN